MSDNAGYLYAAGIEHSPGEFGMMAGPTLNEAEVKRDCAGAPSNLVIFRAKVGEFEPYLRSDGEGDWQLLETENHG